ncbi:MAG: SpoIID/LytB domain-containing protein [Clostridia bacterium]|nr:SpoIID/LytB domain-containing protein [Clostridia bacterium]
MINIYITKKENASLLNAKVGDSIQLPFEKYLCGVVASEIGNAPMEACKAQAIASRTNAYPYYKSGKPISDSSDTSQSFSAKHMISTQYPNAHAAVTQTEGWI